jgi:lipid II:glycine glycyltransferase (peptidoglycan interpeptide bridge formation enzyme)
MESEISVKRLQSDSLKEWNEFINSSRWGDVLQYWEWGETKKAESWNPVRIGVFEGSKLILAAQCLIKDAGVLGKYIYIPHGPVFQNSADLKKGLKPLKNELLELAKEEEGFAIEIEPKIGQLPEDLLESPIVSENLQYLIDPSLLKMFESAGFEISGRNMQPKYKLYYDLSQSEEQLMGLMKKNTRYNVKLAAKKGVKVMEYSLKDPKIDQKLLQFYDLLLMTQERAKGYPVRSFDYFKSFVRNFSEIAGISIFEASFEDKTIAMNISQRTKYWSSSFYAASNRLFPEVKAPYLLRWESIAKAKAFGSQLYDFWGIIPNSSQHQGYSDNKMSFGGVRIDTYGILTLPLSFSRYFIWDKLLPLRSKLGKLIPHRS